MAHLQIQDAAGRRWQHALAPQSQCTIGRATDNNVALDDPRASRYHAHVVFRDGGYHLLNGVVIDSVLRRSANGVTVNGRPVDERRLARGD